MLSNCIINNHPVMGQNGGRRGSALLGQVIPNGTETGLTLHLIVDDLGALTLSTNKEAGVHQFLDRTTQCQPRHLPRVGKNRFALEVVAFGEPTFCDSTFDLTCDLKVERRRRRTIKLNLYKY